MPNYHFRIKSSKRPNGKSVSATHHCEYINREGRYLNYDQPVAESPRENTGTATGTTVAASHLQYINRESIFQKRGGCVYANSHLPKWASGDAKRFFEAADKYERVNGERYKEIEFSLPNELPFDEQRKIVDTFINRHLQDFYYAYAIHDKIGSMSDGERHPHVHIMFSTREIDDIERNQERPPELFFRQYNRKNPAKGGCQKSWKWNSADRRNYLMRMRRDYADIQNEALERNGINLRVDHRTLEAQRGEALAEGNYVLADLLDRMPEKSVGPVELIKANSLLVEGQKKMRIIRKAREKLIFTKYMLKDAIDQELLADTEEKLHHQQNELFAYEHDIENIEARDFFQQEKQEIQDMEKDIRGFYNISIWTPDAIDRALQDAMTNEEKDLWQSLKDYGQEKKEWENLKKSVSEPDGDAVEELEAYLNIFPKIDIALDNVDQKIRETAKRIRPVFQRLNLPHNKAAIQKRAAFYLNDNRLAKTRIRNLHRSIDSHLSKLDKFIKEYFAASQIDRTFSLKEVSDILKAKLARQELQEQKLAKELFHMKKRVFSYPRALSMAKNRYIQGAFKELRADKRELAKLENRFSPQEYAKALQKLDRREQELEARCSTPAAREKITAIAAGILRKNVPIAKEYNQLCAKHRALKNSIADLNYLTQRMDAQAPLHEGNKFRTAPPSASGSSNGSYPTPSRSADLISKAINGSSKEAQLVAQSKPNEPDEWRWLSEAEKDDIKHDMASIDRY